jgi:anti-sigma regulatory factor (Ser/Thr protein kinase)
MAAAVDGFQHLALVYGSAEEFTSGTVRFIRAGLELDEPALVAVPPFKLDAMRSSLNGNGRSVEFWDMSELGRNPGRIIPAVRDWVERRGGRRCRFIGEPIWPGRGASEVVEATRHEALINLAFADASLTILCPYDRAGLDQSVLDDVERTHPHVLQGVSHNRYADPLELWEAEDWPLSAPPRGAAACPIDLDLAGLREFTSRELRRKGVVDQRIGDVVLAVDEAATNALVHGDGESELRIWREPHRVICEISNRGRLQEPLAGRRRPAADWHAGRGVWLMNQLCDLVELRPTAEGTTVRLHIDAGRGSPQGEQRHAEIR